MLLAAIIVLASAPPRAGPDTLTKVGMRCVKEVAVIFGPDSSPIDKRGGIAKQLKQAQPTRSALVARNTTTKTTLMATRAKEETDKETFSSSST